MFVLAKSYGDAWRVFVPKTYDFFTHDFMAKKCVYGGADKTQTLDGIECFGYEFRTIGDATDAIRFCVYTFGR